MAFKWGDIVWANLPFTNYHQEEEHPVVVVSVRNKGREITVAQMTSKVAKGVQRGGYALLKPQEPPTNLNKPGAILPKIFIIPKSRMRKRIGYLHQDDYDGLRAMIRRTLGCE
jgi:mRNA-degrading endonuclease toxin of MazEF toxin-antitoxin module